MKISSNTLFLVLDDYLDTLTDEEDCACLDADNPCEYHRLYNFAIEIHREMPANGSVEIKEEGFWHKNQDRH